MRVFNIMRHVSCSSVIACALVTGVWTSGVDARYTFETCKDRIHGIMNGTITNRFISNQTLDNQYLYSGPVRGFDQALYDRLEPTTPYIKITYEGKSFYS